jgi:hypothetical protein
MCECVFSPPLSGGNESFLSYNSVQFIKVKNTQLAIIYYAVCVLVMLYVVGFTGMCVCMLELCASMVAWSGQRQGHESPHMLSLRLDTAMYAPLCRMEHLTVQPLCATQKKNTRTSGHDPPHVLSVPRALQRCLEGRRICLECSHPLAFYVCMDTHTQSSDRAEGVSAV